MRIKIRQINIDFSMIFFWYFVGVNKLFVLVYTN